MDVKELATRFTYHPPTSTKAEFHVEVRVKAHELATFIVGESPESREQSLAITKLEEAVMWANAGIARRSK